MLIMWSGKIWSRFVSRWYPFFILKRKIIIRSLLTPGPETFQIKNGTNNVPQEHSTTLPRYSVVVYGTHAQCLVVDRKKGNVRLARFGSGCLGKLVESMVPSQHHQVSVSLSGVAWYCLELSPCLVEWNSHSFAPTLSPSLSLFWKKENCYYSKMGKEEEGKMKYSLYHLVHVSTLPPWFTIQCIEFSCW